MYVIDTVTCRLKSIVLMIEYSQQGNRYDGQIAVFGSEFQQKLAKVRYFLVK